MKATKSKSSKSASPPGRMYRRLFAAVTEMKAIRAGEAMPTGAWEVVSDGEGGFVRRQIVPANGD